MPPKKTQKKPGGSTAKRIRKAQEAPPTPTEEALGPLTVDQARFVAAMVMHRGHIKKAAETVGYSYGYARQLATQNASVMKALAVMKTEVQVRLDNWTDMAEKGQRRLLELMDSTDHQVALRASVYAVERVLGKVAQKIESESTIRYDSTDRDILKLALALVHRDGISLLEAKRRILADPTAYQLALPEGAEVEEAEWSVVEAEDDS